MSITLEEASGKVPSRVVNYGTVIKLTIDPQHEKLIDPGSSPMPAGEQREIPYLDNLSTLINTIVSQNDGVQATSGVIQIT